MRKHRAGLFLGMCTLLAPAAGPAVLSAAEEKQPNFVIFLADDMGYGDLACYGHPVMQTPNLDRFAAEGLRLTSCYSACSVCSPSRSAILTGRTPYRNGVWRWIPGGSQYHLRASEISIAKLLKERGYDTCHVGKWHLNGKFNSPEQPQPNDHGYDHWFATQNNAAPSHKDPVNFVRNGEPVGKLEGFSAPLVAEEAVAWLEARKEAGNERPFLLSVWTHEPHLPLESDPQYMDIYRDLENADLRQHHGNISQTDAAFGRLMESLEKLGHTENTFVFFTSDNGPEGNGTSGRTRGSTGGLRGRKRATFEGGIRVPGILRWPGKVKAGGVSDEPVIGSDLFTTLCEITGIPLPEDRTIDGASMLPLLKGESIERKQPLYWRNHLADAQHRVAIRVGDWKIIGSDGLDHFELYNLKEDLAETTELSAKHPEKFAELKEMPIAHDRAVLAEGPDWWKAEERRGGGRRQGAAVGPGEDKTGAFDVVRGCVVERGGLGFTVSAGGEGFALKKLAEPLTGKGVFRLKYQSQVSAVTRNAMFAFGASPENDELAKLGTAIGMGSHVLFEGSWENVGEGTAVKAEISGGEEFEAVITLDVSTGEVTAEINGLTLRGRLPAELKQIEYIGCYVKNTRSTFSPIEGPSE